MVKPNHFENYAGQIGSSPQGSGWKLKQTWNKPPGPSFNDEFYRKCIAQVQENLGLPDSSDMESRTVELCLNIRDLEKSRTAPY